MGIEAVLLRHDAPALALPEVGVNFVEQKVQSYFFNAEVREGRLWGVAECKVRGE